MKHLGLFEGIGGFSLAARWMDWETLAWCEWNEFCQKVLRHHFPEAEGFGDITKTDFTKYANTIDILTGGFPCQPYSSAGKRKGKEDERHLWPEMLRAIREIRPRWIVGENVRGLTNWNGGLVFDEVQAELEAQGYQVLPFLLPACAVDAPHRRDRIWFIAYSESYGNRGGLQRVETKNDSDRKSEERGEINNEFGDNGAFGNVTNSRSAGLKKFDTSSFANKSGLYSGGNPENWDCWPTQSPVCNGDDGISSQLDGITFPKWRNESIKAGGNAIVPQVALQIFKAIEQYESLTPY